MVNGASTDRAASSLGRTCSASCTKAGITALLLSVVALSLLATLRQVEPLTALSSHVLARLNLKSAIVDLDANACWRLLKSSDPEADDKPLVALKTRSCAHDGKSLALEPLSSPPPTHLARPPLPKSDQIRSRPRRPSAPPAPTGLRFLISIDPLEDIEKALVSLGQRDALNAARTLYKYRFGWPIYRWEKRAYQLRDLSIEKNKLQFESNSKNYDFHKYLAIADIRLLADFEFLDASAVEQVFLEHTRLTLPTAATPLSLSSATTLLEFGLLLCVLYFWLFQREARLSPEFPESGTLFAVFGRTRLSRILFLLLTSVPAWSALLLAYWSTEFGAILNRVLAILTATVGAGIASQSLPVYLSRRINHLSLQVSRAAGGSPPT